MNKHPHDEIAERLMRLLDMGRASLRARDLDTALLALQEAVDVEDKLLALLPLPAIPATDA